LNSAKVNTLNFLNSHLLGENMLKRRNTHRFKRNVTNTTPVRRRLMLRDGQRKISLRRRMFALMQSEDNQQTSEAC
jgi:hypothetical protein